MLISYTEAKNIVFLSSQDAADSVRMKAICVGADQKPAVRDIPRPEKPAPDHVIIRMDGCAINPGDKFFLGRTPPPDLPLSVYDVWGVSAAGTVVAAGEGVPPSYIGTKVAVYRSLQKSENLIGTWCEYAQLHRLNCVLLPDKLDTQDYSGSLVNAITPYAFWRQAANEGHKGVLITAGASATGIAMLGIALANRIPVLSLVRDEAGEKELKDFGAENVLVQESTTFQNDIAELARQLETTAVFDGVGAELVNRIASSLPAHSTVYSYGRLGKETLFSVAWDLLMAKDFSLKSFSNFRSTTVQNPLELETALQQLSELIAMPHFKTKRGKAFAFDEIEDALRYVGSNGEKPILRPA
ncbi:MAG: zinc-binding dehydrogenase [Verrucomicrobia bacterium]|nr:zinc-binding dehydrogenase [Verrucomicrobiota bacterium]